MLFFALIPNNKRRSEKKNIEITRARKKKSQQRSDTNQHVGKPKTKIRFSFLIWNPIVNRANARIESSEIMKIN